MFHLRVEGQFSAAHQVCGHAGLNGKLHGHNYRVQVHLTGDILNELGILIDYADVKRVLGEIIERFDHEYLNDVEPFRTIQPTCEEIARMFYRRLQNDLLNSEDLRRRVRLQEVVVNENNLQGVGYSEQ